MTDFARDAVSIATIPVARAGLVSQPLPVPGPS